MALSCIIIDDEPHAIATLSDIIDMHPDIVVKQTFLNVRDSLDYLKDYGNVDVIFSDISLPDIDGLQAAEFYIKYCRYLVFITAYMRYTAEAFEKTASGYLVKPITFNGFSNLIDSFLEKDRRLKHQIQSFESNLVFIKGDSKHDLTPMRMTQITYIQSLGNYSRIHTVHGEEVVTYMQLGHFEKKYKSSDHFFRINKTHIIAVPYIEKIAHDQVTITGKVLKIGAKYRESFYEFVHKRKLSL